ncbi:glycosyltransferase [Collinsella aerofaciens]|uniref:glycosyltransferase n=1 Tax=Collinsella aerofaciens TaxID=74426 RepID=UPI001585E3BC|nr:glycosyltransferase [Collinsella aerofaciens]
MANHNSKISIIVPVYNVEHELSRCVDSILNQSYTNIEVILVDDGSTDRCPSICDAFVMKDRRVRVIHKPNGGLSSARNAGLREASGEWILYVDSDDYILNDSCERLIAVGAKYDCDIVSADAIREFNGGREYMVHGSLADGKCYPSRDFIIKTVKPCEWYAPAWLNLYKRSFLIENNLFFVEGLLHEDMEMQPRVFLAAKTVAYCAYPFYRYVDRASSIMNASKVDERVTAMEWIYSNWKSKFEAIEDGELARALNGHLAKCYLHSCCEFGHVLTVAGITNVYLLNSSLNAKEFIKAIFFAIVPSIYIKVGGN